jgi:hypothetical protein
MGMPEPLKTLPASCVAQLGLISEHRDIATTPSGSLNRTPELSQTLEKYLEKSLTEVGEQDTIT